MATITQADLDAELADIAANESSYNSIKYLFGTEFT